MKTNLGNIDRIVRIVVAIAIIALYFANILTGTLAIILMVLAVVFALTSFISFCPIYYALGWSTKKKQ